MANNAVASLAGSSGLRQKLFWTFMLLAVYRIGIYVPVPGTDLVALAELMASLKNTIFGLFDMFSGGALERLSIFTLGIVPYISASIVMQLLQVMLPDLKRMMKEEGNAGKRKMSQYTRYLTLLLTLIQGFGISVGLENMQSPSALPIVLDPGMVFRFTTCLTLSAGTMFIMWLGEKITEKGIGNGISLIIFAGIIASLPSAITSLFQLLSAGDIQVIVLLFLFIVMLVVLYGVVFCERAQRRVPIQYAKRQVGAKIYGGQSTHLPLKLNTAGVIPPIFASSLLLFPATLQTFSTNEWIHKFSQLFSPYGILYNVIFVILIFFFCYFYTAILFDPKELSENLKKSGGFVPSIRPGEKTEEYLNGVLSRLTLWGGAYISAICILPVILIAELNVPFHFGGTSILIVVGVAMDFMTQLESHLISQQYESLLRQKNRKGRSS
ncbi:MAG: preprotein translocase subunit SecY [Desulfovibrionaceae bacterium]